MSLAAYVEFCFNLKDLLGLSDVDAATPRHIVGFEAIIKPETSKYLHHYTLYAYGGSQYEECPHSTPQNLYLGQQDFSWKQEMIWLWAPGQDSTVLPPEAGVRMLGATGLKAVVLQVHYDNIDNDANVVDTSGFRIYHSEQLRQHDAAILEIGDPNVEASDRSQKIPPGHSKITFVHDIASCTGQFQDNNVTVFTRFFHMHEIGARMHTKQMQDGRVVRLDFADYYDFAQSGGLEPTSTGAGFAINKGDTFEVVCWYSNPDGNPRSFGQVSTTKNDSTNLLGRALAATSLLHTGPRPLMPSLFSYWLCCCPWSSFDER